MIIRFCENLLLDFRHEERIISDRILRGSVTNWEQYRELRGKLNGLDLAEAKLKERYKNMFDSQRLEAIAERSEENDHVKETELY